MICTIRPTVAIQVCSNKARPCVLEFTRLDWLLQSSASNHGYIFGARGGGGGGLGAGTLLFNWPIKTQKLGETELSSAMLAFLQLTSLLLFASLNLIYFSNSIHVIKRPSGGDKQINK